MHRPVPQARRTGGGLVRPDLPGERHHPPADQAPVAPPPGRSNASTRPCSASYSTSIGPFDSIEELPAALDAWRGQYTSDRPHQSLAMGFPASRFTPASSPLELRIPAQLADGTRQPKPPRPAPGPPPAQSLPAQAAPPSAAAEEHDGFPAVEVDRVVPPSGNLWIGG